MISYTRQGLHDETKGEHWVLCLVGSYTRQRVGLIRALESVSYDITHETRGTICQGHWVLHLVI